MVLMAHSLHAGGLLLYKGWVVSLSFRVISGATRASVKVDIQMMFPPFPGLEKPVPLFFTATIFS